MNIINDLVNKKYLKKSIPDVATGDVVRVSQKITEGTKTRIQVFEVWLYQEKEKMELLLQLLFVRWRAELELRRNFY